MQNSRGVEYVHVLRRNRPAHSLSVAFRRASEYDPYDHTRFMYLYKCAVLNVFPVERSPEDHRINKNCVQA